MSANTDKIRAVRGIYSEVPTPSDAPVAPVASDLHADLIAAADEFASAYDDSEITRADITNAFYAGSAFEWAKEVQVAEVMRLADEYHDVHGLSTWKEYRDALHAAVRKLAGDSFTFHQADENLPPCPSPLETAIIPAELFDPPVQPTEEKG